MKESAIFVAKVAVGALLAFYIQKHLLSKLLVPKTAKA